MGACVTSSATEKTGKQGRPHKDNRTMLNGMLWIDRSDAQWRDDSTRETVFHALSEDADMKKLSMVPPASRYTKAPMEGKNRG